MLQTGRCEPTFQIFLVSFLSQDCPFFKGGNRQKETRKLMGYESPLAGSLVTLRPNEKIRAKIGNGLLRPHSRFLEQIQKLVLRSGIQIQVRKRLPLGG